MFILALAMNVSLFANAVNSNIKKTELFPISIIAKKIKPLGVYEYSVTIRCHGRVHTSCCYASYAEASAMGDWMIVGLCNPYNN